MRKRKSAISGCNDQRPDLGESERWEKLYEFAFAEDFECGSNLDGMRAYGTELKYTSSGKIKLEPKIGRNCWASRGHYEHLRDKYLVKHRDQIIRCLDALAEYESQVPEGVQGITRDQSPWPSITGKYLFIAETPQARREMQEQCPWAWVFNPNEVRLIGMASNPEAELFLRGKTGSVFRNDKEREAWNDLDN